MFEKISFVSSISHFVSFGANLPPRTDERTTVRRHFNLARPNLGNFFSVANTRSGSAESQQ